MKEARLRLFEKGLENLSFYIVEIRGQSRLGLKFFQKGLLMGRSLKFKSWACHFRAQPLTSLNPCSLLGLLIIGNFTFNNAIKMKNRGSIHPKIRPLPPLISEPRLSVWRQASFFFCSSHNVLRNYEPWQLFFWQNHSDFIQYFSLSLFSPSIHIVYSFV